MCLHHVSRTGPACSSQGTKDWAVTHKLSAITVLSRAVEKQSMSSTLIIFKIASAKPFSPYSSGKKLNPL